MTGGGALTLPGGGAGAVAALVTLIGGSSPAASRPGQCGVRTVPAYLLCFPSESKRRARIKLGDELEFRVSGGIINIIRRLPAADDEYTPKQRRIVDARLAQARKGPYCSHEK